MTAKEFLKLHGQSVDNVDINLSVARFMQDMKKGLNGEPAMPMIPTYIMNPDRSKIKPNSKRILIDAGGTNFRSAVGYFDEQGRAVIEKLQKSHMPGSNGEELTKADFYNTIADNIHYLLDDADDIGFCFSYQVNMDKDVDGEIVMFSKEIKAPQVVGTRVGRETLNACKVYGDKERKIVILNDTVATLLGGMALTDEKFSAYLGYIYGTGTNVCYIEDTNNITKVQGLSKGGMLINTECGNFEGFNQGDFDKACIARTAVPTKQLFEKTASGKYLADVIAEAFAAAKEEGLFENDVVLAPFELKDVSSLLNGEAFPCKFNSDTDKAFAMDICKELIERAAKMGAIVNAAIAISSCKDLSLPVAVVAEGTTFNKLPNYKEQFELYLSAILASHGMTYKLIQGEELNLIGTLMATFAGE